MKCRRIISCWLLVRIFFLILMVKVLYFGLGKTDWIAQLSQLKMSEQFSADLPGCTVVITGDADRKKETLAALLSSGKRRKRLSEDFYIHATKNCPAYIEKRSFITVPLSVEEMNFPIAFSMVVHENIEMFERLLRAVYAPQNIYCVHVDQKSSADFQEAVRAIVSCFPNVFIATKLERVIYASWSRVQADLNCMEDLVKSKVQWKYLLNTCGSDFPIKTNREMVKILKVLNGKNSMESEKTAEHKKIRWQYHFNVTDFVDRTEVKKSPPPINTPMFQGNAYIVVSRAFVEHLMYDKEVQKFLEWEKDTYSPDEHMWATLQRMPSVPGSLPSHWKYDQSDLISVARLVKWADIAGDVQKGDPYYPCTGAYRRAVCVYGVGDLQWLLGQNQLIANKFDPLIDDVAIRCLEAFLRSKTLGFDPLSNEHSISS